MSSFPSQSKSTVVSFSHFHFIQLLKHTNPPKRSLNVPPHPQKTTTTTNKQTKTKEKTNKRQNKQKQNKTNQKTNKQTKNRNTPSQFFPSLPDCNLFPIQPPSLTPASGRTSTQRATDNTLSPNSKNTYPPHTIFFFLGVVISGLSRFSLCDVDRMWVDG